MTSSGRGPTRPLAGNEMATNSPLTIGNDAVNNSVTKDVDLYRCVMHRTGGDALASDVAPSRAAVGTQQAYDVLRGEIVGGLLMPNERLVESDLAEHLGTGRAVVRTVLTRLETDGLVVREPHRGARVRRVGEAEAVEIIEARAVLEALGAAHAALRATDDEISAIRSVLTEMTDLAASGDLLAYSDCNARLHAAVLAASRHGTAQRMISGLKAQMVRFQYRTILVPGRAAHSLSEHTAIVEAIEARDPEAAREAMYRHLHHVSLALHSTASRTDGPVRPQAGGTAHP